MVNGFQYHLLLKKMYGIIIIIVVIIIVVVESNFVEASEFMREVNHIYKFK